MEQIAYYPGDYTISIEKEKYHPYQETVTVEEGKLTTVCPVLVPKAYKHNTFLLAEAGFAMNPSWGVGLMVGQVYGEVRSSYGIGWYVQGRSNFQSTKMLPALSQAGSIFVYRKPPVAGGCVSAVSVQ